jgi:hypothetical protein
MSATLTFSLTLWIVELMTPSSTTWAPSGAMKRPSEVPPPVENFGLRPVSAWIARVLPSERAPGAV